MSFSEESQGNYHHFKQILQKNKSKESILTRIEVVPNTKIEENFRDLTCK